jgi:N-acetylmuramate 1-kinase
LVARPPPAELLPWARSVLGHETAAQLDPVAGDASARRYFRLKSHNRSFIVVHAPPESEKNREFLAVRSLLEDAGIRVPALLGTDLDRGYLLLGDLGDRLLLDELNEDTVDARYRDGFELLHTFGAVDPKDPDWPAYDDALFSEELSRFPAWFVQSLLGAELPPDDIWRAFANLLKQSALAQPRVFVHRDFHSRNLMPQPDGALAVIDFQDSVMGPVTYDLVSLLRDCYIRWQPQQVEGWALEYLAILQGRGELADVSQSQFLSWFDLMGLERHIKVLGTFARLYLRDRKPAYLKDMPLVVRYVREILEKYRPQHAEIAAFAVWFEAEMVPVINSQDWSETP